MRTLKSRPSPVVARDWDNLILTRSALYTPDGELPIRRIGKGMFSTAYVTTDQRTGRSYVLSVSDDEHSSDKEIAAMAHDSLPNNPHIPAVERFGSTGTQHVWKMPFYKAPLRKADDPRGWKDYAAIKKCLGVAERERMRSYRTLPRDTNQDTVECAARSGVRESVVEALDALAEMAGNYSEFYKFEFSPRNLATDDAGRLVLLDVLFNVKNLKHRTAYGRGFAV